MGLCDKEATMHLPRASICIGSLLLLAACGGGGSDAGTAPAAMPPNGTTSTCFNNTALTPGTVLDTLTRATYPGATGTATFTSHTTVGGITAFNGASARQAIETMSFTPDAALAATGQPASTSTLTHFYSPDSAAASVKEFGDTGTSTANGSATATTLSIVNTPYVESRFTMTSGGSFTQSYTSVQTATAGGVVRSTTYGYVKAVQYNGIVSVTVPAGTFQACQFVETGTVSTNGSAPVSTGTSTHWVGVTNGVLLRTVTTTGVAPATSTSTFDLLSASINGAAI